MAYWNVHTIYLKEHKKMKKQGLVIFQTFFIVKYSVYNRFIATMTSIIFPHFSYHICNFFLRIMYSYSTHNYSNYGFMNFMSSMQMSYVSDQRNPILQAIGRSENPGGKQGRNRKENLDATSAMSPHPIGLRYLKI